MESRPANASHESKDLHIYVDEECHKDQVFQFMGNPLLTIQKKYSLLSKKNVNASDRDP